MSINTDLLRNDLNRLGMSIDVFSALSGIPSSTLSMALRGMKDLTAERFRLAVDLLAELRDLAAFHAPVPISWQNVTAIRELLDKRRASKHAKPTTPVDPWSLLSDLIPGNIDEVLSKNGWSREQLLEHLADAQKHLHAMVTELAAHNDDRARLHPTSL